MEMMRIAILPSRKYGNGASFTCSTTVEDSLQIGSFMQNKPNFQDGRINLKSCNKKGYENKHNWTLGENKPKQSQFTFYRRER